MQTNLARMAQRQAFIDDTINEVQNHFSKHKEDYVRYMQSRDPLVFPELSKELLERGYSNTYRYTRDDTDTIVFTVEHPY